MSLYATYPHLLAPNNRQASSTSMTSASASTSANTRKNALGMSHADTSTASGTLGIGAKLRNMLESQKYAVFDVAITIHELGNVPQLQGEFNARWRFRGKTPKVRDTVTPAKHAIHKPSLPNLKFTHAHDKDQASSSSLSIRSNSTGTSSIASTQPSSHGMKGKSMSTPPLALTAAGLPKGKHRMVEKKGSDPTPLRNSVKIDDDVKIVDSPAATDTELPIDYDVGDGDGQDTPGGLASRSMTAGQSSSSSNFPASTIGTASSASSSTSYLSVPPSSSTPTRDSSSSTGMERSASQQTTSGQSTYSQSGSNRYPALGVKDGERPNIRRTRSSSTTGPGPSKAKSAGMGQGQSSRSGTTPSRPLKSHTCTWDQELHLTLRLPISKDRDRMAALGIKSKAPLLGEGAKSASGLRLVIQQLPTPSAIPISHSKNPVESTTHSPATSAAIRNGSVPAEGQDEESRHEKIKDHAAVAKGKPMPFGRVNIDLAAFAGRGRTTRKFLLKGSRTNATVQISVDMTWIGGDDNWIAPPLQEGHHVTRVKDIVGRDASENLQKDLQLMQTPSQSSDDSSLSHDHSSMSHNASSINLPSGASGGFSKMHPQYKSWEHHLLSPEDAKLRTPTTSSSKADSAAGQSVASPEDRKAETAATPSDGETGAESASSPQTPTAASALRSPITFWNNHRQSRPLHHAHYHLRHRREESAEKPKATRGISELPPEIVIENIFNPHSGRVDGPFTYVAVIQEPEPEPVELRGEAEHHEQLLDGAVTAKNPRKGWMRRKTERKDTASTVNMGMLGGRSVSGLNTPAAASRNPSPPRLAKVASSTAVHA